MSQSQQSPPSPLPASFGRYEVIRLLGAGAMGAVYLAHDPVLDRKVALKVIAIDPSLNKGNRDEYLIRFSTEARASAKLNHPSIVQVYDAGDQDGTPWIAFQFIEGHSLEAMLQERGKLPVQRAVGFAQDIAQALGQAHASNIIHRDIKPANILIETRSGTAKLADFGVVKAPWTAMTQDGETLGSPGYMSPEQVEGGVLDARADLFSLGVVLYQAITGIHPFLRDTVSATVYATCAGVYQPVRETVPDVPLHVEHALRHCLSPDKNKRIGSALELAGLLENTGASAIPRTPVAAVSHDRSVVAPAARVMVGDIKDVPVTFGQRVVRFVAGLEIPRRAGAAVAFTSRHVKPMMPVIVRGARRCIAQAGAAAGRIRSAIPEEMRRKMRTHGTMIALWGSLGGALLCGGAFVVSMLISAPVYPPPGTREARLVRICGLALENNGDELAADSMEALAALGSECAMTHLMIARIMLRDGQVDGAVREINIARGLKRGKAAIKHDKTALVKEVGRRFSKGNASSKLIDMTVYSLDAARHPLVRYWAKEPGCWLRRNAVRVLAEGSVKINMTPVYLLDLDCDDEMDVRLNAVRKLGERPDSRAIAALRKVTARGFGDPFVAMEARRVLERLDK